MDKKITKRDYISLSIVSVIFIVAMIGFSCYTSPLYPNYFGWDSAIFSLLGKGMVEGKELYIDLFDHKGPVIFMIDALGHMLGGRTGIFLLQCISGLITLYFLYFTGKMLRPGGKYRWALEGVCLFLCTGAVLLYTMENGNLTEEYSLPFISCCCYFFMKYALNAKDKPSHPRIWAVVYGVAFAIISLLRLNNGVTVAVGVLVIMIYLLYRKQYINLLWNLAFGLIGILLVYIPTAIYFYLHSSLNEMIYATFIYNFLYAGNAGHTSVMENTKLFFMLYLPMLLSLVFAAVKVIKERKFDCVDGVLAFTLLINIACLWLSNRFPHYFVIFVPVYYLMLCRYVYFSLRSAALWLALLCAVWYFNETVERTWTLAGEVYVYDNPRYTAVAEDMSKIPPEERDSVIGFEIMAMDYLAGDIIPCYKYYTLQSSWAVSAPEIIPEFMDWVQTQEPLWVLTTGEQTGTALDAILLEKYELQFSNPYIYFYRLAD